MSNSNGIAIQDTCPEFLRAVKTCSEITKIYIEMVKNSLFPGRLDIMRAITYGLCSGEHVMLMSPPGTGKSTIARYFADAMGLGTFVYPMGANSTWDDLYGYLDPEAAIAGKIRRSWGGLARSGVVLSFLDEMDKAPASVRNYALAGMEERTVWDPETQIERPLDLHTMISAVNTTIEDTEALLNRYTLLVKSGYITDPRDFRKMRHSIRPRATKMVDVSLDDLSNLRTVVARVAVNETDETSNFVDMLWANIKSVSGGEEISDRLWQRAGVIAAGRAISEGRVAPSIADWCTAEFVLWRDPDNQEKIASWIASCVADATEFPSIEELKEKYDDILTSYQGMDLAELGRAEVMSTVCRNTLLRMGPRGDRNLASSFASLTAAIQAKIAIGGSDE